eukprot:284817784_2
MFRITAVSGLPLSRFSFAFENAWMKSNSIWRISLLPVHSTWLPASIKQENTHGPQFQRICTLQLALHTLPLQLNKKWEPKKWHYRKEKYKKLEEYSTTAAQQRLGTEPGLSKIRKKRAFSHTTTFQGSTMPLGPSSARMPQVPPALFSTPENSFNATNATYTYMTLQRIISALCAIQAMRVVLHSRRPYHNPRMVCSPSHLEVSRTYHEYPLTQCSRAGSVQHISRMKPRGWRAACSLLGSLSEDQALRIGKEKIWVKPAAWRCQLLALTAMSVCLRYDDDVDDDESYGNPYHRPSLGNAKTRGRVERIRKTQSKVPPSLLTATKLFSNILLISQVCRRSNDVSSLRFPLPRFILPTYFGRQPELEREPQDCSSCTLCIKIWDSSPHWSLSPRTPSNWFRLSNVSCMLLREEIKSNRSCLFPLLLDGKSVCPWGLRLVSSIVSRAARGEGGARASGCFIRANISATLSSS